MLQYFPNLVQGGQYSQQGFQQISGFGPNAQPLFSKRCSVTPDLHKVG